MAEEGMEGLWQLLFGSGHSHPPLSWHRGTGIYPTHPSPAAPGGFGFGKGFIHKAKAAGKQSLSWGPCNVGIKQIRARSACGGYKQTQPGLGVGRERRSQRQREKKAEGEGGESPFIIHRS